MLVYVYVFHLLFSFTLAAVSSADYANGREGNANSIPRFLSRGQSFRVVIGDTLVLPCEVQDLGEFVLLWRRGSAVLTADKIMVVRDPRFQLVDGFNLQVSSVMPQDAGDYVCQIGDGGNTDQIHTVEILVPPSIRTSPTNGQLTARKGGTVTLECKPSGNPVPTVIWTRRDNLLPSGQRSQEGFSISLDRVDRHQAGVYQCTASNGVGNPVTVDMQLDILYPPEIDVERSWVHSGEGYEAQLVCIVYGEPVPNVMWYQDSFLLDLTDRRTMETRANRHTLTVRHVQGSDFGNYSCVADNSLGRAKKYMELSGKPSPAEFRSAPFSRAKDTYNLTWLVESYPALDEVRLLYRKVMVSSLYGLTFSRAKDTYNLTWLVESYPALDEVRLLYRKVMMNDTHQMHGKWHDVILQPTNGETFSHLMSYNIRGLQPAAVYEAIVQAKNKYGWNEVTDAYQFYTRGLGHDIYDYPSEPSMEDMELVASGSLDPCALAISPLLTLLLVLSLVFL